MTLELRPTLVSPPARTLTRAQKLPEPSKSRSKIKGTTKRGPVAAFFNDCRAPAREGRARA